MMNEIIMPGPAFWAAVAVRTKMPVPITAPIPSMVSWKAPSDRLRLFFSAVARMASRGLTRPKIMCFPLYRRREAALYAPRYGGFSADASGLLVDARNCRLDIVHLALVHLDD